MTVMYFEHKDIIGKVPYAPFAKPLEELSGQYAYRGCTVDTVWIPGEMRPFLARQLRRELRIVMGLWSQPGIPVLKKAELSGCADAGEFLSLNRKLRHDRSFTSIGAINHCLLHGLPRSAAVNVYGSVVCADCGARTEILPCMRCWDGPDDDLNLELDDPEPSEEDWQYFVPTRARAGSLEKIEAMRQRVKRNLPLFHPSDFAGSL